MSASRSQVLGDVERMGIELRKSRLRPMYEHGCGGGCGKFPGWCHQHILINGEDGDTKSRAGRRVVGLPAPLMQLLREHQAQQDMDRAYARQPWRESGRVFTSATGEPLNPNSDYHRWKALLKRAGVRDGRLPDAN
jgi:integrase